LRGKKEAPTRENGPKKKEKRMGHKEKKKRKGNLLRVLCTLKRGVWVPAQKSRKKRKKKTGLRIETIEGRGSGGIKKKRWSKKGSSITLSRLSAKTRGEKGKGTHKFASWKLTLEEEKEKKRRRG